jgi:hypothetical protein
MMLKNLQIFEVKFNVRGSHLVFQIVVDRIENALPIAYKLCAKAIDIELANNALDGQYFESIAVTKTARDEDIDEAKHVCICGYEGNFMEARVRSSKGYNNVILSAFASDKPEHCCPHREGAELLVCPACSTVKINRIK